jgi:hypothetical protein
LLLLGSWRFGFQINDQATTVRDCTPRSRGASECARDHFSKVFVKQIPPAGEATGTAIDPIMMKLTLRDEESQQRTTTD